MSTGIKIRILLHTRTVRYVRGDDKRSAATQKLEAYAFGVRTSGVDRWCLCRTRVEAGQVHGFGPHSRTQVKSSLRNNQGRQTHPWRANTNAESDLHSSAGEKRHATPGGTHNSSTRPCLLHACIILTACPQSVAAFCSSI